jgi:hypothetical protein
MSALAQCDAFAYIYDQAGDPAPDVLVVLKRVLDAGGNPILLGPKTTLTDSAGAFHFTLPELSTAFISARASALWNCPDGRAFTVPPGPSGELVPDFSLPASTLVEPPLVYVGDVLSIPRASTTQDGYLSAADFAAFEAGGAEVGITQIDTGAGLTGGPITDTGTIGLAPVSGVAGTWSNPSSITINAYGQIIAISGVADTTAPVISAISATAVTSSGATILWTTDDFSDSQVEYGTTTSYGSTTTLATTPVTSHSVPITGTASSQLYHYRVKSRNTSGLLTTSGDNTFTTTAAVDTTPPVISAISAGTPTETGATITWTTDEASDSQVDYGPTTSYGSTTTLDAAMVTSHSVPITGLTASTLYHYHVKSRNAASLLTTSADNTLTTIAGVDLMPGLLSYWKMDETGLFRVGESRHDETGNNDLTIVAPIVSVTGKISSAVCGLGSGYLVAAENTGLHLLGSFTITFWMAIHSTPEGWHFALAKSLYDYAISYIGPSTYQFRIYHASGGAPITAEVTHIPVLDEFVFVAAVVDEAAGEMRLSLNDGTLGGGVATTPFTGPIHESSDVLGIMVGDGGAIANIFLDEVGIWTRALSNAEISALYNLGVGLSYPF